MNLKLVGLGVLVVGLSMVGCNQPSDSTTKTDDKKTSKKHDDHDHGEAPHGGTIIEFGKYHGEFVVDHAKKTATVYILDDNVKNPVPIAATKLQLSIEQPQFQVDLIADPQDSDPMGKSSRFVATHDNFGKEQQFAGTLSGEVDGRPYLGDFKEEPHKDHDHGK